MSESHNPMSLVLVLLAVSFYFIPSLVAMKRDHPNAVPIFLVNAFFGWTVIGWVGALVWSFTAFKKE